MKSVESAFEHRASFGMREVDAKRSVNSIRPYDMGLAPSGGFEPAACGYGMAQWRVYGVH